MAKKYKKRLEAKELSLGQKLGKFTILKEAPRVTGWNVNLWECQCECGEVRVYSTTQLRHATSCGCLRKARMSKPRTNQTEKINNKLKSSVYCQYTRSARNRDLEFLLSRESVEKLSQQNCYYCDAPPSNRVTNSGQVYYYSGLDRVDNEKGYLEDNVVPCCKNCNHFKGERDRHDFIEHLKQLYRHITEKLKL